MRHVHHTFIAALLMVAAQASAAFESQWSFTLNDPAHAELPDFDDSAWRKVDLPHDWSIEGAFDRNNPAGGAGAFLPTGIGWYRKHFTLPSTDAGRRILVEFD